MGQCDQIHKALAQLQQDPSHTQNQQGEFYLTDLVDVWVKAKRPVYGVACTPANLAIGANTPEQLYQLEQHYYRNRALLHGLKNGVRFTNIDHVYLRGPLTIGKNVSIGPGVELNGPLTIDHVTIEANCVIKNTTIGAHATIHPHLSYY